MPQPVPSHMILDQCGVPGPFQHRPDNFASWDQFPEVGQPGAYPTLDETCAPLLVALEHSYEAAAGALRALDTCDARKGIDSIMQFGREDRSVLANLYVGGGVYQNVALSEVAHVWTTLRAEFLRRLEACAGGPASAQRAEDLLRLLEEREATAEEAPGAMPGLQPLAGAIGGGAPAPANPPPGAIYQQRPGESLETYSRRMATWRKLLAGAPAWGRGRR